MGLLSKALNHWDIDTLKYNKGEFKNIPSNISDIKKDLIDIKSKIKPEIMAKVEGDFNKIIESLETDHERAKNIKNFFDVCINALENADLSISGRLLELAGLPSKKEIISAAINDKGNEMKNPKDFLFGQPSLSNNYIYRLQFDDKMEKQMLEKRKILSYIDSFKDDIARIANKITIPTQNASSNTSSVSYGSSKSLVSSVIYNSGTSSVSDSNIVKNFENTSQISKETETIYKEPSGLTDIINNSELYTELVNQIKNQFPGMSDEQAMDFIEKLSTSGILTYSSMSGVVINSFENIGGEFNIFNSFVDSNGTFNEKGLIMDIFANTNDSIFLENGNYDFSQNQVDIGSWGENVEANMHEYFESKGLDNLYVESSNVLSSELISSVTESDKSTMIFNEINNQLLNNENIIINVKFENGVSFINPSTNETVLYQDDKIHSLYVTGVTEDSITITSFGNKYNINPTDIAKNEHNINIIKIYKQSETGKVYL